MILLSLQNIVKHYGPEPVLDGVTFDIRPAERVSLVGPNGAGKTTLMRIVAGLTEADSGRVEIHTSATLGYLEQHPEFEPGRTVWDEAATALANIADLAGHSEELASAIATETDAEARKRLEHRFEHIQQEEIAKLEDCIRRYHLGDRHQQAEDRRKKLERIERVAAPREIAAPPMSFPEASRTGDIVLRVEKLAKGFPGKPLFANLSFDILRGEKWGILGSNGCGKTKLLRCLLGELAPDDGRIIFGTGVKPGYFDQMLTGLDDDVPVLDAVRP